MPSSVACWLRRFESWKFELPPSTSTSPASRIVSSSLTVFSVISPAGIIIQTARGGSSCSASSCSEEAVASTFGS
jgi:hypothetical protein